MAVVAIGPCMFLAPLVFLLMLLAIPLWPVGIMLVAVLWLITAPTEWVLRACGVRRADGATRRVTRWLRFILRPWRLFDKPAGGPPLRRPAWRSSPDGDGDAPPPDQSA